MEAIEVTARFDVQGNITPLNFSWKGGIYQVESTGRHWQDVEGMHFLVMVSGEKIYELTYRSGEGRWFIDQAGPRRMFV
ncbi:MAG: hypothetical protein WAV05_17755 [Anaerolineales bacterium]